MRVYYFYTNQTEIPIIYEQELVHDYDYCLLVIMYTKRYSIDKASIKYSTDKKEIEEEWRTYVCNSLLRLEALFNDTKQKFLDGAEFLTL
jgi:hypothetical protein